LIKKTLVELITHYILMYYLICCGYLQTTTAFDSKLSIIKIGGNLFDVR